MAGRQPDCRRAAQDQHQLGAGRGGLRGAEDGLRPPEHGQGQHCGESGQIVGCEAVLCFGSKYIEFGCGSRIWPNFDPDTDPGPDPRLC